MNDNDIDCNIKKRSDITILGPDEENKKRISWLMIDADHDNIYNLARKIEKEIKKLEDNDALKNDMSILFDRVSNYYCSHANNYYKVVEYQDQLEKMIYDNNLDDKYYNCGICKNKKKIDNITTEYGYTYGCDFHEMLYWQGKCTNFEKDTEKEKLLKKCEVDSFLFSLDNVDRIIWGTLRSENPELDFTTLEGTEYIDLVNKIEHSEDKRRVLNFLKKNEHCTFIYFEKDTFIVKINFITDSFFHGYNFIVVDDARKPGLNKVRFFSKDECEKNMAINFGKWDE